MHKDHIGPVLTVFGHTFDVIDGHTVRRVSLIDLSRQGDYGSNPVFDNDGNPTGLVQLVPSGRIVTLDEKRRMMGR